MSNLEWAKREVELACQKENPNKLPVFKKKWHVPRSE